jgi:hypothetical protein
MAEQSDFKARQFEFAAYLRDPDNQPAPADVEERRMVIYRDLFFNNVRNLLAGTFPILAELLGDDRWTLLIRDFYRDHQSHSPLFPDVPKEFLRYLADERPTGTHTDPQADPAFMQELAHYEWVEAGLMLAEDDTPHNKINTEGDLLAETPVTSRLAWLLNYAWPVNEIGRDYQPDMPADQPLYYLVYRDTADKVIFVKLNTVSARLFEILRTENMTGFEALKQVAAELNHPEPEKVISKGKQILQEWRTKDIVVGTLI